MISLGTVDNFEAYDYELMLDDDDEEGFNENFFATWSLVSGFSSHDICFDFLLFLFPCVILFPSDFPDTHVHYKTSFRIPSTSVDDNYSSSLNDFARASCDVFGIHERNTI